MPESMTPERADMLIRRWRWGSYIGFAVYVAMYFFGVPPLALVMPLLTVLWCLERRAMCQGWLTGYRTARTEDLRRDAGELL
jgi:hypothetical protein